MTQKSRLVYSRQSLLSAYQCDFGSLPFARPRPEFGMKTESLSQSTRLVIQNTATKICPDPGTPVDNVSDVFAFNHPGIKSLVASQPCTPQEWADFHGSNMLLR